MTGARSRDCRVRRADHARGGRTRLQRLHRQLRQPAQRHREGPDLSAGLRRPDHRQRRGQDTQTQFYAPGNAYAVTLQPGQSMTWTSTLAYGVKDTSCFVTQWLN
jgi:hypothetical protein